jgi:hypothetical protein
MAKMEKHDKAEMAADKKMIKSAMAKHEKAKHPGQPLTKLKAGGKTNADMLKYGRNMAKVMNQRSTGRKGA